MTKKLTPELAYWAAVKKDPLMFAQHAFNTVHPRKEFMLNWHHEAIINFLERSFRGELPRAIVNMPPRHLKSFLISVAWPAFLLGADPTLKIFCVSYSDELAKTLARDFRRIVESDWFRRLFPNVRLVKTTENEIATDAGGFRYAVSVGGTLTGRGADLIIIDDPARPEEAISEKMRQAQNDWFRGTLLSRLDDKARSAIILVMQRLHVNDLTGFIENSGGFQKLSFPAIAMRDEEIPLRNGKTYFRRAGEALQAERESVEVLGRMRDEIGKFNFASQYQQSPETPEGTLFKREWFKIITQAPKIDARGSVCISIDSASSTADTADFSAITVVYAVDGRLYVLRAERGRWDYEKLKAKAESYMKHYQQFTRKISFVIENANSGVSLYQSISKWVGKIPGLKVFYCTPKRDKIYRAALVIPAIEEKPVFIVSQPGHNDWVEPFIEEFLNFPNGRFDDQVDSLVQVLSGQGKLFDCGRGPADEYSEPALTRRPRRALGLSPFDPESFWDVWNS